MPAHNGVTSQPIETSQATYTAITILTALAWYNVLELNFLVFNTFRRYRGLYFWALLISSWGTLLHGLGFILKIFPTGTNVYVSVAVITVGWYCMVTGQSVVLYSRIHLVVQKPRVFRIVLVMIIVDAILFHIPTTVLTFGANSTEGEAGMFTRPYQVMEKIQMTAFSVQETIISVIYAHAALKLFQPLYKNGSRKPLVELLVVNLVIIAMDLALLGVEYASLYDIEVIMKSLIYSIKLKLEFAVLTELKSYANPIGSNSHGMSPHFASGGSKRRRSSAPTELFDLEHAGVYQGEIAKIVSTEVTSLPQNVNGRRIIPEQYIDEQPPSSPRRVHSPGKVVDKQSTGWISPSDSETELGPTPDGRSAWS